MVDVFSTQRRAYSMIVIGIVGAPAGGKSTVARRLREHGATWINADKIAHRCLDRPQVRSSLAARFGDTILNDRGQVDRKTLGNVVFGDDAGPSSALDYLESVVHPLARRFTLIRMSRAARCGIPAVVLDAPLLLEADWGVLCDFVWCVDAPETLRAQWIKRRGWTLEELRRRESRQMDIGEKRRLATNIIENDLDESSLLAKTDHLWSNVMSQSSSLLVDTSHCLNHFSHGTLQ
jgi:dephospho-CoA kinase